MAPLCWLAIFAVLVVVRSQNMLSNLSDAAAPDKFLENFGYLPAPTTHGAFHSPESRVEAVKEFQRMAHLPDTGILDDETRRMMLAPRCGVPDRFPSRPASDDNGLGPQNYELPGLVWKKKKLTWKMHNFSPDLDIGPQRYALWRAFKYWSDVSGMEFRETAGEADINIKFGYGDHGDPGSNAFDGPGMILAHAYFPESGMLHFDEAETWSMRSEKGTNLRIVGAHEIGHALGLSHSTVWEALMAPWYTGYVSEAEFDLHRDDVDGIQYLYGRNTRPVVPRTTTPEYVPPETTTTTTTTTTEATTTTTTTTAAPPTAAPTPVAPPTAAPTPVAPPTAAPTIPTRPQPGNLDPCTMKFDAAFNAPDNKVYVLRGNQVFRLDENGVMPGFPMNIRQLIPRAPRDVGAAVYSRSTGRVYLFKARRIWRYTAGVEADGTARFRLDRGFPVNKYSDRLFPTPEAALVDGSGKVLLLAKDRVYQYSEYYLTASVEPESLANKFPGIPTYVDAALNYQNFLYFFKGDSYRKYASGHGVVAGPKSKAGPWIGCGGRSEPR